MALQSITNNAPFVKPKLMKEGDTITGYYTGKYASEKYPESPSICITLKEPAKVTIGVKEGDSYVDKETTLPAGDEIRLNASGNLKYFLDDHETGCLYQFVYKGMKEITTGPAKGKMSHNFEILKDADDKLVAASTTQDDLPF